MDLKYAKILALALVCISSDLTGLTNAMNCSTPPTDAPRVLKLFLQSSGTYSNNVKFCHAMGGEPIAAKSLADNDAYAATINSSVAASSVPSTVGSAFHFGLEESPLDSGVWKWHHDNVVLDTMCHYAEFANTTGHGCLTLDATRASGSRWVADGDCTSTTPRYGCNFYPSCTSPDGYWIGLKYIASTGKYVWSSGETMTHCQQASLWEPDPTPTSSGEMCYVLQYDSAYKKWRFRQRDCSWGTAGGALCRLPLCGYLPTPTAFMKTTYRMGLTDDMIMGVVMNYTCVNNPSIVHQTICQNGNATWSADPRNFVCPLPPVPRATMECFPDKSLANLGAILATKPNPTSVKKCSAMCVKHLTCQGIYVKVIVLGDKNEPSRIVHESSAKDDKFQCNLFSLGRRVSSADMTGQVGSKVCRHSYRDGMFTML